jgi:hypothetical protein
MILQILEIALGVAVLSVALLAAINALYIHIRRLDLWNLTAQEVFGLDSDCADA